MRMMEARLEMRQIDGKDIKEIKEGSTLFIIETEEIVNRSQTGVPCAVT